jgi:hypothetical protein
MKTFKNLKLNDIAWIIDESFNVYEVKLMSKNSYEGFTDNIVVYQFSDMFDNETIVSLPESSNEEDDNWAFCAGGKIYLDKEPILKKLEMKSKDINDMINYLK